MRQRTSARGEVIQDHLALFAGDTIASSSWDAERLNSCQGESSIK